MGFSVSLLIAALALALQFRHASAVGTNDQINNPDIDYGTFENPSVYVRPRFRYWVPDASVNLTQVQADVADVGRVGAGGVELLGYYIYGNVQLFPGNYDLAQSDWTVYGFGSLAWKELQDTVLSTAQDEGLVVDMALGPNQGAGVPAPYNSDGLLWDLSPFETSVSIGDSFSGVLPGWGSGPLVSASTGLVLDIANFTTGGSNTTLAQSSLTDITSSVGSDGSVNVTFSSDVEGIEYRVFAYYLKQSLYSEVESQAKTETAVPQSPITTYEQNGSWVVDHFSALGAQTTIDFWTNNLLDDATITMIKEVGNYVWEDSQEFYVFENTYWTPNLTAAFLANRGYSVNEYVPLLFNTLTSSPDTVAVYILDQPDAGHSHVEDYRQTLTELNQIYLQTITSWAENILGIQFSAQIVYNLPMDMLENIPYVNAPECETLAFLSNVDGYRQFAGPANLAGKRIISSESGAQVALDYQQTIYNIVQYFKRSIAGGVNQFIIHGYPHTGNYGNTSWPGFTTFDYTFSEMHGRHQPGWDFYSDFLNWTARTQWVAQTGTPRIDLAFWLKSTDYRSITSQYSQTDLEEAGFTYEYLSPENFALPAAVVSDEVLAPDRQGFKALVIPEDQIMTGFGVSQLVQYAQAGLPIIFYGGLPTNFEGYEQSGYTTANATISSLTSLDNVHVTAPGVGLASTLSSINITPLTAISANSTWRSYWREAGSVQYAYVYNDAGAALGQGFSTGTVAFGSVAVPYFYDAWTGAMTPVLAFTQTPFATTIYLELAGDQTVIIAFVDELAQMFHLESFPESTLVITNTASSISVLRSYIDESSAVTLSNGTSITLEPMLTNAFTLTNWTLIVESWTAPTDIYDLIPDALITNLTAITGIETLASWTSISSSLTDISGRGYYSTSFQWPPTESSTGIEYDVDGAYIDLDAIYHTVRVFINGNALPPLDVTWARADISAYLVSGTNSVDVVVSTPLGNALNPIWNSVETSGRLANTVSADPPAIAGYGLLFPVQIIPYRKDMVDY